MAGKIKRQTLSWDENNHLDPCAHLTPAPSTLFSLPTSDSATDWMVSAPAMKIAHNKTLDNRQTPFPTTGEGCWKTYRGRSASSRLVAVKMKTAGSHQVSKMKFQTAPGEKGLYVNPLVISKHKTQVLNSCPYKAKQYQKG